MLGNHLLCHEQVNRHLEKLTLCYVIEVVSAD